MAMINRKKLVEYLRAHGWWINLATHKYIEINGHIIAEIEVDSTDFGAILRIYDNRNPQTITRLLNHFTYESIHTDYRYTQYSQYSSIGQYIIKLLDFKHDT